MAFLQAKSKSCIYYRPERPIRLKVHGGDFTVAGSNVELQWFADGLKMHWTIDIRVILGPPSMTDLDAILNRRLVTWAREGAELEVDPCHVDLISPEVGCKGANVTTPPAKERVEEVHESELLSEEEAAMYRSANMRLAFYPKIDLAFSLLGND